MTVTLPDTPSLRAFTADELLLELACALYQRGRLGKVAASELAGIDPFSFQQVLHDRGQPSATEADLESDVQALKRLFPA